MYRISRCPPGDYVVGLVPVQSTVPVSALDAAQTPLGVADCTQRDARVTSSFARMLSGGPATSGNGPRVGNVVVDVTRSVTSGPTAPPPGQDVALLSYSPVFYPSAPVFSLATVVSLAPGEARAGLDLIVGLRKAVEVTGIVSGPPALLNNVSLTLSMRDAGAVDDIVVGRTLTTDAGEFHFLGVPPGQYQVNARFVSAPPLPPVGSTLTVNDVDGYRVNRWSRNGVVSPMPISPRMWWASVAVAVGDETVSGLTLDLREGFRFAGTIDVDDSTDRPPIEQLRQAVISVEPRDCGGLPEVTPGVVSSDGTFETAGVPAGPYFVRIGNLPAGWHMKAVMADGNDISDVPIELTAGVSSVRILLTKHPAVLSGNVTGSPRGPAGDIFVVAFPVDERLWSHFGLNPRRLRSVYLARPGPFAVEGLPAGDYFVAAVGAMSRDWRDRNTLLKLRSVATRVTVREGAGTRQDVTAISLGGAGATEAALHESVVAAARVARPPTPPASEPLISGPWVGEVSEDETSQRDVGGAAPARANLRGSVTAPNPDGGPIRRAIVALSGGPSGPGRMTVTDDDGQFAFIDLPAGHYGVTASKPGYLTTRYGGALVGRPVTVGGVSPVTISMKMYRGATVGGSVHGPDGSPLEHALVRAVALDSGTTGALQGNVEGHARAYTDDEGAYRLYGLPPGRYAIRCEADPNQAHLRATSSDDWTWLEARLSGKVPSPPEENLVVYASAFSPSGTDLARARVLTLGFERHEEAVDCDLERNRAATVQGHVRSESLTRDGRVNLSLLSDSGGDDGSQRTVVATTVAAQDGLFSFVAVPSGHYAVRAQLGTGVTSLALRKLWAETTVDVVGGRDVRDLELNLRPAMNIYGRVNYEGRNPSAEERQGLHVRLLSSSGGFDVPAVVAQTAVKPDDSFVIQDVLPGKYFVTAFATADASSWHLETVMAGGQELQDRPLDVGADTNVAGVEISFGTETTELTGVVQDELGQPASDVSILVFPVDPGLWRSSRRIVGPVPISSSGQYRVPGLPAGDYLIAPVQDVRPAWLRNPAVLRELAVIANKFTLESNERKQLNIQLPKSAGSEGNRR